MLEVTVNESNTIDVAEDKGGTWLLNDIPFDGDLREVRPNHYHVIWRDRSFNVEVVVHDPSLKITNFRINGQLLTTAAKDRFDLLLESMGIGQTNTSKINNVKAPMPGLIQSISVAVGDTVQKGDTLLVLVAMKMENAIKAPGEGTVKAIQIAAGNTVEKNQVLIEFA
jgi:biotin carboxyl carrier protein